MENNIIIRCINITDDKIEIKNLTHDSYDRDEEVIEELLCGCCGLVGEIVNVPKTIVEFEKEIHSSKEKNRF